MARYQSCRSCGAAIVWAETSNGKAMPVDSVAHPDGNILLTERAGIVYARVVGRGTEISTNGIKNPLRRSHFSTCPNAVEHRKPKPPKASVAP